MLGGGGPAGYLLVHPAPALLGHPDGLQQLPVDEALLGLREAVPHPAQPPAVHLAPRGLAAPDEPLPEQELRQLVPRAHEVAPHLLAQPREVAVGLLGPRGAVALHDVSHGEHAGEEVGVASVGLDPVAGRPEHLGDGPHGAGQAEGVEPALEVEAGRAALVDRPGGLGQGRRPRGDLRRVVAPAAERGADDLARLVDQGRGRHGPCVYVETDAGRVGHGWDLP